MKVARDKVKKENKVESVKEQTVTLNVVDLENFLRFMDAVLVEDSRVIPLRKYLVDLVIKTNEESA